MPLTDTTIRNSKPSEKPIRLFDGGGLYLEIAPSGGKWWRLKYRFDGKEKRISLGVYPDTGLKDARSRRDEARKLLADGVDPGQNRKTQKSVRANAVTNSFELVAREWCSKKAAKWTEGYQQKIITRLEKDIFPWIGARPITEIEAPDLLATLRRIENRGAIETAHRALQDCGGIFRYAIQSGRAKRDIAADLRGALTVVAEKHHASITDPKAIGDLLRVIAGYQGSLITKCGLNLAPLVFVRPGELRKAEWQEFDFEKAEWRIPATRMKMGKPHIVPLSTQAIEILKELQPLTGTSTFVFPGARTNGRPMSENTINAALRRLGYSSDEMTGHGFRSMASTLLNEQGWNPDAIERQLAHTEKNNVRAAYNYAEHLAERRRMMQGWADYLDGLKTGAVIIPFNRAA